MLKEIKSAAYFSNVIAYTQSIQVVTSVPQTIYSHTKLSIHTKYTSRLLTPELIVVCIIYSAYTGCPSCHNPTYYLGLVTGTTCTYLFIQVAWCLQDDSVFPVNLAAWFGLLDETGDPPPHTQRHKIQTPYRKDPDYRIWALSATTSAWAWNWWCHLYNKQCINICL